MRDGFYTYTYKIPNGTVFDYASMPGFLVQSTWTAAGTHDFWYMLRDYPRLTHGAVERLVINKVARRVV